jgi:hypothetical protein
MRSTLARTLVLSTLLLAPLSASAEEVYFSMLHLQGNSRLFAEISVVSQKNNERIQREVVTTGRALDSLGDGLEAARLHTGGAPEALSARHTELAAAFDRDWTAINGFVDQLVLDTDRAFTEALAVHVGALEEAEGFVVGTCEPPAGVLGMAMGQGECEGRDVTPHVVASLDADEDLSAAVADICGREWPAVRPQREAVVPLTLAGAPAPEDTASFSAQRIYQRSAPFEPVLLAVEEGFRAASREVEMARQLHEANRRMYLESQPSLTPEEAQAREAELTAELDQVKAASEALTRWRTDAVAGAVALAWQQVQDREGAVVRELAIEGLAVCLQPPDLGGCTGPDVTDDVAGFLEDQKKVIKEASRHAETVGSPDLGL